MRIKSFLLGAALMAGGLAGVAPRASAITPAFEYATQGGFVMFSLDMKVYSTGFAVCTERFMRNNDVLIFTGRLSASDMADLRAAVPANFQSLPGMITRSRYIPDIANIIVSVRGKSVTVANMPGGTVHPDAAFDAFAGKLSAAFSAIADAEYCHYGSSGGFAFQSVDFTLKNNGRCHLTEQGLKTADKDGYVSVAELNDLKAKFQRRNRRGYIWYQYPASFATRTVADGFDYAITWDGPSGVREVDSDTGGAANEGRTYQLVKGALQALVGKIETQ